MSFRCLVAGSIAIILGLVASPLCPQALATPPYQAETDLIEVMFAPDSQVRLRDGRLLDLSTNALDGVDAVVGRLVRPEWSRICDVPEQTLDDLQARGKANSGLDVYNLNNIYRLRFEGADVWTVSADLEALPGVMRARPVPKPIEPPLPPDYQPMQNYEDPASFVPTGVDAEYAWTQPGGDGSGVTVCDLEYSWNYNHNDVTKAVGSQINVNVADPFSDNNHGTAVIGELVSDDNAPNWGTKGVCYGSGLKTCGTYYGSPTPNWNVPGAIAVAIANLNAGDIILLEQQWAYTFGGSNYVPIEWWTDYSPSPQTNNGVYAAIVNAVTNGIHVVEAGGNGSVNTSLMSWYGDSGAIIVGAGGAYPGGTWPETNLERLSFSSYGPRFNLQGWGENVVTTGYGYLYNAEGVNRYYTSTFSGTSSASPIVAGAVACVQGYYLANISPTPLPPAAMRTLLVNTGTPQYFGLPGNIGPRPDCFAAIASISQPMGACCYGPQPASCVVTDQVTCTQQIGGAWMGAGTDCSDMDGDGVADVCEAPVQDYEYGDAPEQALAYPGLGVFGSFPTCVNAGGPASFVSHAASAIAVFLGPAVDYEPEGNAGNCAGFPPYDADECWNDGDSGLLFPPAYTIDQALNVVPCQLPGALGTICTQAVWGQNLDLTVMNQSTLDVFVNVVMDWDQNGVWMGASNCPTGPAPEHVLVNFIVPAGYMGALSALAPPPFLIGPNPDYVWTRFTISETACVPDWDGSGVFVLGETSDYLLRIDPEQHERAEYGDAPEGAIAYPAAGTMGTFPTCVNVSIAGFVSHQTSGLLYIGPSVDLETDGNAGNCPNFPPYDADECWSDGDAGLLYPGPLTIDAALNVVPCPLGPATALGLTCNTAVWGQNLDLQVTNGAQADAFVNVLMDWNKDGAWQGASTCPNGPAREYVLVDFLVPPGFSGPLSALGPPPFMIGPHWGHVWSRFTISPTTVGYDWNGSGSFSDGETSDYLIRIDQDLTGVGGEESPIAATRLLASVPNPFRGATTIRFEVASAQRVSLGVYDVAGRRIRSLLDAERGTGRYSLDWDGRNEAGERVSAGMYFVRLRAGAAKQTSPIILLR